MRTDRAEVLLTPTKEREREGGGGGRGERETERERERERERGGGGGKRDVALQEHGTMKRTSSNCLLTESLWLQQAFCCSVEI